MSCSNPFLLKNSSYPKLVQAGKTVFLLLLLGGSVFVMGVDLPADTDATIAGQSSAPAKTVEARIDEALAIKNVTDRLQDLAKLSETLSLTDIPAALNIASHLKSMRESMVLQYSTLERWSELEPREAFEAIAKLPEGRQKGQTLQLAAGRFAQKDAQAAAVAVLALAPEKSRQAATDAVAAAWAKTDGTRALAWAKGLPDGLKDSALYALRFSWVHADPVSASADVVTLPPGNTKNALIANIAEEWTTLDSTAASQWAKGLPDGPEKEIALSNTARTMADRDPLAAANFALSLAPPALRQNAVIAVVTNWATQQPKDAGNWVVAQEDPDIQKNGIRAVLSFWTVMAPAEAGEWIESIQSKMARDTAVQDYAQLVAPWAPELGASMILSLAPETAGQPAALECAHQWLALDPVSARRGIEKSKLPADVKAQWVAAPAPVAH